ncbi:hypothetical protein SDC9_172731 [bioreactor metagenome]|uniref:Formyl-CoA transferase n=1 Tax=bioreactor metagenome TaxID=1076179 RepID=A0A645GNQ5_9ZZZZ
MVDRLAHFKEVVGDEQALQNGFVTEHTMPNGEACFISRPSARFDSTEVAPTSCAPLVGADTVALLGELGLTGAEIEKLVETKAVYAGVQPKQ